MDQADRRVDKLGEKSKLIAIQPLLGRHWHDERSQREHYWKPSLRQLGIRWRRAYNTPHT